MKAWLRKWWVLLLLVASCFVLLSTWSGKSKSPPFHVGTPLPPGAVKPQLLADGDLIVLLAPDGSLWAWGGQTSGSYHSIFGTPSAPLTPQKIGTDTNWRRIATTGHGILGVKADGSLWAQGWNIHALLQAPSAGPFHTPFRIGTETNWLEVSADSSHVLALKRDGSLWSWGNNWAGQVGVGNTINEISTISQVGTDLDWQSIVCGRASSFAMKRDGTLWAWGCEPVGNKHIAHSPVPFDPATNWAAIVPDDFHVMGLRTDGTLWSLGSAPFSSNPTAFTQLGTDTNWQEIVTGRQLFFARKADGSWWVGGENRHRFGAPSASAVAATPVKVGIPLATWAIAASSRSVVVLAPDGKLWTWGQRPGAPTRFSKFEPLLNLINKTAKSLVGRELLAPDYPVDDAPQLVWELPSSVKSALGTNVPSPPKTAP